MSTNDLIKPNSRFEFTASSEDEGLRLDKYLSGHFPLYSRTFLTQLIQDDLIKINNKIVTKSSTHIKKGDVISVQFPPPRLAKSDTFVDDLGVKIMHEDKHFLVVYKPAGLIVHPPTSTSTMPTLVDWILNHYKDIKDVGPIDRPGIIHRLDKDTSGLVVVPRTNYAFTIFGNLFRDRDIKKTYYAVVKGHPDPKGIIDLPIGRDPFTKIRMSTRQNSSTQASQKMRDAVTHYKVVEYFDNAALVELKPVTGRTHQIRVHLAAIGHPIIGDTTYGESSKLIKRHALHAATLSFIFDGTPHAISCDLPEDIQNLIKMLRKTTTN